MKTILHSFGFSDESRALADRLNFTDVIEPCDMFNPQADQRKLDTANEYGMKVWLDVSRYVKGRGTGRWDTAFTAWTKRIASHPALAGAYVYGDPELEIESPQSYAQAVSALRAANLRTAATFSHLALGADMSAKWLNYCDYEGIGVYTKWGGDAVTASAFDAAGIISGFSAALSATGRANVIGKWLFLQGFVDEGRGGVGQNGTPTKEEYQRLIDLAPGWDVGFFGLSSSPDDVERIRALGLRPDLHDEVMFTNAKLLGRPAVYPSRVMVRLGQTAQFICPAANAQWSADGANDIAVYQTGGIRAGTQAGRVVVTAKLGAQTAQGELFIYRED